MANLDIKAAEKAEMEDAIKAGDTSKFVDSVEAKIAKDCEDWALKLRNELNGSEDEHILAERGVHVLTSAEKKYYEAFKLDKWKLRQSVSAICSNSWVKAKKKLTVEKDYNLRVAQKSLWHSMRLYMFAIQIAQYGEIYNFTVANDLWEEIKNAETPTWEYYKEKYQAKFNELRSDLVKLCDRPKEE